MPFARYRHEHEVDAMLIDGSREAAETACAELVRREAANPDAHFEDHPRFGPEEGRWCVRTWPQPWDRLHVGAYRDEWLVFPGAGPEFHVYSPADFERKYAPLP